MARRCCDVGDHEADKNGVPVERFLVEELSAAILELIVLTITRHRLGIAWDPLACFLTCNVRGG